MSGWIKFEKDLQTDPRVIRIARTLTNRCALFDSSLNPAVEPTHVSNAVALPAVTLVCGALVRMWSLADTHVGEDDILALPAAEIDTIIGIPNFCSLLPADWLIDRGDHVQLPDFHIHNGTSARKRDQIRDRVSRYRVRNSQPLHGGNAVTPLDLDLDQTKTKKVNPMVATPPPDEFFEVLRKYPKRSGNNPKADAMKAWKARLREGVSPSEMLSGLSRYVAWCEATGKIGTEMVMQAARFFGKSRPFEQEFLVPKSPGNGGGQSGAPWWSSDAGVVAKAAEVGVVPLRGESYRDLKVRVDQKLAGTA